MNVFEFVIMESIQHPNTWMGVAGVAMGIVGTIVTSYLINVKGKGIESQKEVDMAKVRDYERENAELNNTLSKIRDTMAGLEKDLEAERALRQSIESKYDTLKALMKVVFNEYSLRFKEDPEQMNLLNEIKQFING